MTHLARSHHLESDQLEAALLEAGNDLADEAALDAVRPVGVSISFVGPDRAVM
jgi:hypothetical protein